MFPFARLSLTLALVLCSTAVCADTIELPAGFDGEYAPDGAACGSLMAIKVENGTFIGGDGAMSVTDLIEDPENPRKLEVSLLISGGGGEWTDAAVITLSEDGQSLNFDYTDGSSVTWPRCE